jgi:RluA family pseudouridine synthase
LKHNLQILWDDEQFVAVNKPAGILSIPDRFNPDLPNILHMLLKQYPEIIPVHRLDKYTSGVNIFAKNAEAHRNLSLQFEKGEVEKYYYTIVDGIPEEPEDFIDLPLAESTTKRGKMVITRKGKPALTQYKVLESFKRYAFLAVRIFTGRMHQIRVHMQAIGHPLIVDSLYGKREAFYISEIKTRGFKQNDPENMRPLLDRQPLHAYAIILHHPVTNAAIRIEAELPKDMQACLNQLRKWSK